MTLHPVAVAQHMVPDTIDVRPYDDVSYEFFGQPAQSKHSIRTLLARQKWLILATLGVTLALGLASIFLISPMYRAQATVQVEQQPPNVIASVNGPMVAPDRSEADRFLRTQIDIIHSRTVAAAVAQRLNLANDPRFTRDAKIPANVRPDLTKAAAIQALQNGIQVTPTTNSRILAISYESSAPELAAAITNAVADAYIISNMQRRFDSFSYSRGYLDKQLKITKPRLEFSERSLIAYARSAGLVDPSGAPSARGVDTGQPWLTTANLVELNNAYAQARATKLQAQERWQQAQATSLMSLPEVLSNPAIQELTKERAELQSAYEQDLQRRQASHPAMQQEGARIAELNRQISSLAGSVRSSIGDQYRVAARQESALVGTVGQLKAATLNEQEKGVRYNILKREVDSNRGLYNALLEQANRLSSEAGLTANNISILDAASPPLAPYYPQPVVNLALAGFGGLALGLLLAFVRERINNSVRSPVDIERHIDVPLLGVVPKLKGSDNMREALEKPRSPIVEAHHSICMLLDTAERLPKHSVLLLTSSRPHEGKSTTAMKIAANLAATGRSVLLIDGDIRRGSLHDQLGLANKVGLADVLLQRTSASEAMQQCGTRGLVFISRGSPVDDAAELLSSPQLTNVMNELREKFDAIVIDGPPVLGLADAPRFAATANATLFVVEAHSASWESINAAVHRLRTAGGTVIGLVLTKFDSKKAGTGTSYEYIYDYGIGDDDDDAELSGLTSRWKRALRSILPHSAQPRLQPQG